MLGNESVRIIVASDYADLSSRVARLIADRVRENPRIALGLATGSSPLGVYAELIRLYREEDLDFSEATCFNLDEYYPMLAGDQRSYREFMECRLFRHINCRRWNVPDGRPRSTEEIARDCREYEDRIASAGGIDLQLLGIGRDGHIGFNEPGSSRGSRTRLAPLHPVTRQDAAAAFGGLENVPRQALSMGIGTILEAREIVMMASGAGKAEIVRTALEGEVCERVPASLLRTHPNASFYLDRDAARLLSLGSPNGREIS